jgi:predicted regulator of Ras-like GTPase activity (Roadblock/LC7/MglB family)
MSSLAHHAKKRMAGMLQRLLGKLADPPPATVPVASPQPAPAPVARSAPAPVTNSAPLPRSGLHTNGKGVELPLQPILATLPLELQPRLKRPDAGAVTISVPLQEILPQLSSGAVKISFGELRQAAPDLFTGDADRDQVPVSIPLAEVLSRLNPALIRRRREQKPVEVPGDIRSPFDRDGQGLVFSMGPSGPEAAPAPPARQTTPAAPIVPPARSSLTFTPAPTPPSATPPSALTKPPALTRAAREMHASPAPVKPTPPSPPPAASSATRAKAAGLPTPLAPVTKADNGAEPLVVALTSLAEGWPEAVCKEIVQLVLVDAKIALPVEAVERALKQGRVAFSWKTLRSWIKPAPLPSVSAHDGNVLELPLKIVAPLFLARQREASKAKKKVSIDENIPNLFFGFPQPEGGAARPVPASEGPPAKAPDTNYYIWDDNADRARLQDDEVKLGRHIPSPGTRFVAKYATPNEVVSRAAALDDVAGALIALPDGLMVASRLSPDLNGDTLAAFLPQIFAKVNQCTKELRMGELNNLNFTVGNVPWKIFRVNAIFFAAFGRAGEGLPTAKLAALAAELDHKPK